RIADNASTAAAAAARAAAGGGRAALTCVCGVDCLPRTLYVPSGRRCACRAVPGRIASLSFSIRPVPARTIHRAFAPENAGSPRDRDRQRLASGRPNDNVGAISLRAETPPRGGLTSAFIPRPRFFSPPRGLIDFL